MKSLKSLLHKKLPERMDSKKMVLDDKTAFFLFRKVIQQEFGNLGAVNFQPEYFDGKKIFVKSKSSNWSSELWLNRQKIIKKLNQEIGAEIITDIKLK